MVLWLELHDTAAVGSRHHGGFPPNRPVAMSIAQKSGKFAEKLRDKLDRHPLRTRVRRPQNNSQHGCPWQTSTLSGESRRRQTHGPAVPRLPPAQRLQTSAQAEPRSRPTSVARRAAAAACPVSMSAPLEGEWACRSGLAAALIDERALGADAWTVRKS